jgi:hypothetical protein
MKQELIMLLNTMALISVRGEDAKLMAQCLQHTENMIRKCDEVKEDDNNEHQMDSEIQE